MEKVKNQKITKQKVTMAVAMNGAVAALYTIMTLINPLSYAMVQFRVSEVLTILPIFFPTSYVGLTVGCLLSNILSPVGVADMIFGSLATLAAGVLTSKIRKIPFALLPPILLNALAVPLIWYLARSETVYWINVLSVGLGQAAVILILGIPLYYVIKKNLKYLRFDRKMMEPKQEINDNVDTNID
jgi:uncharacterized membrane protein